MGKLKTTMLALFLVQLSVVDMAVGVNITFYEHENCVGWILSECPEIKEKKCCPCKNCLPGAKSVKITGTLDCYQSTTFTYGVGCKNLEVYTRTGDACYTYPQDLFLGAKWINKCDK